MQGSFDVKLITVSLHTRHIHTSLFWLVSWVMTVVEASAMPVTMECMLMQQCIMWESLAVSYVYFSQNLLQDNLIDIPYRTSNNAIWIQESRRCWFVCISVCYSTNQNLKYNHVIRSWLTCKILKQVRIRIDLFTYDNRSDDSCKFHLPITSGSVQVSILRVSQW